MSDITQAPKPSLTLLGNDDAASCEGGSCALPSLADVSAAVERAFSQS